MAKQVRQINIEVYYNNNTIETETIRRCCSFKAEQKPKPTAINHILYELKGMCKMLDICANYRMKIEIMVLCVCV